jgi:HPr kinase/phosphorylase
MSATNIHASCVILADAGKALGAPGDAGVLLLGESGAGKSDLALRLIERGAVLVADDRVDLFVLDNSLWARVPENLAGRLEVRGLGILAFPHREAARIDLAVQLTLPQDVLRMPEPAFFEPPLDLPLQAHPPLVRLAPFEASAAAKIGAACAHALFSQKYKPK